jgi:hypothetical protein
MITAAGEALIDLIIDPRGGVEARPGGGPFTVARPTETTDRHYGVSAGPRPARGPAGCG